MGTSLHSLPAGMSQHNWREELGFFIAGEGAHEDLGIGLAGSGLAS